MQAKLCTPCMHQPRLAHAHLQCIHHLQHAKGNALRQAHLPSPPVRYCMGVYFSTASPLQQTITDVYVRDTALRPAQSMHTSMITPAHVHAHF